MRGRPHLMGAVAQATRKSWERRQGLSTKGSSAGLSDVLSDVSSAYGMMITYKNYCLSAFSLHIPSALPAFVAAATSLSNILLSRMTSVN
jgi:hypothetical protein